MIYWALFVPPVFVYRESWIFNVKNTYKSLLTEMHDFNIDNFIFHHRYTLSVVATTPTIPGGVLLYPKIMKSQK